jgi:hypothetical protein
LNALFFPDTAVLVGTIDFWRVSLDGLATHVRPFWEDREDMRQHSNLSEFSISLSELPEVRLGPP